jgi:aspartyl protease family protein
MSGCALPRSYRPLLRLGVLCCGWVTCLAANASEGPSVSLSGVLGSRALIVVDGGRPKSLAVGEIFEGVRLVSLTGEQAVVDVGGRRQSLFLGEAPVQIGNGRPRTLGGRKIEISSDASGHFMSQGSINGRPMRFLVDTGATTVAISQADADRMGLRYQQGQQVSMATANGLSRGWRIQLDKVRVGDVEVQDVEAIVSPQAMPFVLLGNSYLTRFQMHRVNETMTLEKKP